MVNRWIICDDSAPRDAGNDGGCDNNSLDVWQFFAKSRIVPFNGAMTDLEKQNV